MYETRREKMRQRVEKRVKENDQDTRGVLSGKVGTGMCGPDRVLFRALRFCNGPLFYLNIGFDIGCVFAKCIISDEFFLWFIYRLSKSTYASQFNIVKSTDWF